MGRGRARLIRSAFRPLCFNNFCKLFVALGEDDASVSLAALRKTGSLVPPRLGALLVSFRIPAIRHQNLYLTDVHGVAPFSRRECDQIATYGELSHDPPRLQAMDARELRQKAMHYRRVARSVSDEAMAKALLEVAAEYDSLVPPGAAFLCGPVHAQPHADLSHLYHHSVTIVEKLNECNVVGRMPRR